MNKKIKEINDLCYPDFNNNGKDNKNNINSNNDTTDFINKYNNYINKQKEKIESIIENDDYIEFSNKLSKKNINVLNQNQRNRNPRNDLLNYQLSSISSLNELKRTKTQVIQRQFRKYLSKKGYYGHFDKRKIAVIYLLKNMIIYNIRPFILNMFILLYKDITNMKYTQEDNYFNIESERIDTLNKNYIAAINEIN